MYRAMISWKTGRLIGAGYVSLNNRRGGKGMPGMHAQEKLEDGRSHRGPVGSDDHKRVSGI